MNISYLDYTFTQKALDVYLSGCLPPHCPGCHNPELWDFDVGQYWIQYLPEIDRYIQNFGKWVHNIMIFGGEPLDQNLDELAVFLRELTQYDRDIWLFTRYDPDGVPDDIKRYLNFLKCGRYERDKEVEEYEQFGIKLATSNQVIYKLE